MEKRHEAVQDWKPVRQGDAICAGDFVHTGRYSRAGILIEGADTLIRLDENTTFQLVAPEQEPRTLIELIKGAAHFISRVRHNLEIRTPFVSSYIDGTEFLVRVDDAQTTVVLYEGDVLAKNDAGSQAVAVIATPTAHNIRQAWLTLMAPYLRTKLPLSRPETMELP